MQDFGFEEVADIFLVVNSKFSNSFDKISHKQR
jgi:hypothetical protein